MLHLLLYKMKRIRVVSLVPIVGMIVLLTACSSAGSADHSIAKPISDSTFIFDTIVSVRVYDDRMSEQHFSEIRGILEGIDERMNRHLTGSEIDLAARQAGQQPVQVSADTFKVVRAALAYADTSQGVFDPTVGPLVDLWGIGTDSAAIPPEHELAAALELVNYQDVELNEDRSTIMLTRPGMILDLGAIAKGYAADVVKDYLQERGFKSAIIDLGGNIIAMGDKPGGLAWSIGIQDPSENRGEHLGILKVSDKTIVTSGIYERFFRENDKVYHHILDTDSGYPVWNDLLSVSIITDTSMDADAMSTTTFALGLEAGMAYIEALEHAEAIFVTTDKQIHLTSGMQGQFELTNGGYQYAD